MLGVQKCITTLFPNKTCISKKKASQMHYAVSNVVLQHEAHI